MIVVYNLLGPDTSGLKDDLHVFSILLLVFELCDVPGAVLVLVDAVLLHVLNSKAVIPFFLLGVYLSHIRIFKGFLTRFLLYLVFGGLGIGYFPLLR